MDRTYDAIVVGARVAGAATAMLLARAGLDVLVVDRRRPDDDTLSTHAFMRGGVMQLSRWGLLDEVIAAGTPPVHRTVIRYGDVDEVVDVRPSPHAPALYAPRRTLLDRLLVEAAEAAGVDVRFGVTCTGLTYAPDGSVTGVRLRDRAGRTWAAHAPITIGADGLRSRVAREVGAVTYERGTAATAMVVGYVSEVDVDGYQWLYGARSAAGLLPTNDGRVCVWTGTPHHRFDQQRQRPDRGFWAVLQDVAPDWSARLRRGRFHGPLRGFPGAHGFLRQPWGRGWALVGDASHFKDPLTAHGMTDALRDAELLADAVVAAATGVDTAERALAAYQDERDRLSRELLAYADRTASYAWDMTELRRLLLGMSAAMRPEVEHLRARDEAATITSEARR